MSVSAGCEAAPFPGADGKFGPLADLTHV